jgi:hypothetical protein
LNNNDLKVVSNDEIRKLTNNELLSDDECQEIADRLKKLCLITAKLITNGEN